MASKAANVKSSTGRVTRRVSFRFGKVAHSIMHDPNLSLQAKGLYGAIACYADGDDRDCYFNQQKIAPQLGISVRQFQRLQKELVQAGYLEVVPETMRTVGKGSTNQRTLNTYVLRDGELMVKRAELTEEKRERADEWVNRGPCRDDEAPF